MEVNNTVTAEDGLSVVSVIARLSDVLTIERIVAASAERTFNVIFIDWIYTECELDDTVTAMDC